MKALIFSTTWGIFLGDGSVESLWRHQQWSPSLILPRSRNQVWKNSNFLYLTWENNTNKHFTVNFQAVRSALQISLCPLGTFLVIRFWLDSGQVQIIVLRYTRLRSLPVNALYFELFNCLAKEALQKPRPDVNRVNWCQVVQKVTIYHR